MMSSVARMGEGGSHQADDAGLDETSIRLLAEDFAPLDDWVPEMASRLVEFVLTGKGPGVLHELVSLDKAAQCLRLRCTQVVYEDGEKRRRVEFFGSIRCVAPEIWRRIGLTYEAASRQSRRLIGHVFGDPRLDWLEILLVEATQYAFHVHPRRCHPCAALNADLVEAMIELEGAPRSTLVRSAFQPKLERFGWPELELVFVSLEGLGRCALKHRDVLLEALRQADFKQRSYALTMIRRCRVPTVELLDILFELTFDSSKQVRELAIGLLSDVQSDALPLVECKIAEGKNQERVAAARLIWKWKGESSRKFLEDCIDGETNRKVIEALQDVLAVGEFPSEAHSYESPALLPVSVAPTKQPLGSDTEKAWLECLAAVNAGVVRLGNKGAGSPFGPVLKTVPEGRISLAYKWLNSEENGVIPVLLGELGGASWMEEVKGPLSLFWERPELTEIHLVRFLILLGAIRAEGSDAGKPEYFTLWLDTLFPALRRSHPQVGFLELGFAFASNGISSWRLGEAWLDKYGDEKLPFGLPPSLVWPYWMEHLEVLKRVFEPISGDMVERWNRGRERIKGFHALACFPKPPMALLPQLWQMALGPKTERVMAQQCLAGLEDKVPRLEASLKLSNAESRSAAAEWLGRIGDQAAVAPLRAALKKEPSELAKGVMMSALEQLGAPLEHFLDPKELLDESRKGLAKGIPKDLDWFPFDGLPQVRWDENGQLVEVEVVQWWLVQGFKLKNPEPSPLIRKYTGMLRRPEREALGQYVLEAWLCQDTIPIPAKDAEALAMEHAQFTLRWSQSSHWPQSLPKKSLEGFYQDALPAFLKQPKGTAISSKGILSISGACAGSEAAPAVSRYVNTWYGMRTAQCRALLQMLSWVDCPNAIQLLLGVGSRFRTKSIQEEAIKLASALADRKGWTLEELADRTIPSAGMDENGKFVIDFGPRVFWATLDENQEFSLYDSEAKRIKSLPAPRVDDDEAKAAAGKKAFATAKKEVKAVFAQQRDRLYEAMCTQRVWSYEDWDTYLNRHPIVRHHCQRTVWIAERDEKEVASFRPLVDGSLTNSEDDQLTLKATDRIRLAHQLEVLPAQAEAWCAHLRDYEVVPLFVQFGQATYTIAENRRQESELADYRGYLVEAFKLRGRAAKLGYLRGAPEDGGWFYRYHKRFIALGLEAVIEFTGNRLPEENRTVALLKLGFARLALERTMTMGPGRMALGDVPRVLLSECWNDLRQMAADGSGYDSEWEKKTGV